MAIIDATKRSIVYYDVFIPKHLFDNSVVSPYSGNRRANRYKPNQKHDKERYLNSFDYEDYRRPGARRLLSCRLGKELVDQIVKSAQNIERDATLVSKALKTKQVNKGEVTKMIGDMTTDVNKLQELVTEYEASKPSLSDETRQIGD